MKSFLGSPYLSVRWVVMAALAVTLLYADTSSAQVKRRPRRPERDTPPPPQRNDKEEKPAPGRQEGWVLRLKAADEEDVKEDEKLMGFISIKPYAKGARVLKLRVYRDDDVQIVLGDHKFELESLGSLLEKGLHVAASWDFLSEAEAEKKRGGKKVLRKLELLPTEIEGEVKEITDDLVVIYGRPVNKANWPDYVPDDKPGAMAKPEEVKRYAVKLKLVEDVSKFRTAETNEARLSDFKVDDKVRVRVC